MGLLLEIARRARAVLGRRMPLRVRRSKPTDGLPPGLAWDVLDEVCSQQPCGRLKGANYVHLSSWKQTGCYRVFVWGSRGRWSVIYKNSLYSEEQIPALTGLPVAPGIPEWVIYSSHPDELSSYLPSAYRSAEVVRSVWYTYLLEDLSGEFEERWSGAWMATVASRMPALHRAMNEWVRRAGRKQLLRYDGEFHDRLQDFVWRNMETYLKTTPFSPAWEMWSMRPRIAAVCRLNEFRDAPAEQAIHGDLNLSNILHRRGRGGDLKIIDWEWAGMGDAHADLASLLKHASPGDEERVLGMYAAHDRQLTAEEHRRRYEWCKLERAMLDAAFLAVQSLMCPHKAGIDLHNHVGLAARNAMRACRSLGKATAGVLLGFVVDYPEVGSVVAGFSGFCR